MTHIKELREQLQREKLEGRERPWGYRVFQRGPSIYITLLLSHTPLTPNAITLLSILSGLGGAYFLLSPDWKIKFLALFLFYLNLLLDRVDGEIARYKKQFSLKGIYLDELNHYIIPPLFFLSLAWGLKNITTYHESLVLLAGIWAGFSAILLRLTHNIPYGIFLKKYVKNRDILPLSETSPTITDMRAKHSFLYALLRTCHQFQDFFITLVLFALTFGIERFFIPYTFLSPYSSMLLFAYAVYLPLIVLENIVKGVLTIEARMKEISSVSS
ncbi:MAG: hypothetical protein G01um101470_396 [Parcubacteria group bacterium Gr01-1014_70]|nr:MAG: hypothetical protein G01um101470_396 [Parcubacteria group bacterium Gr01-1014_70]